MEKSYTYKARASWELHRRGYVKAGEDVPYVLTFSAPPDFGGEPGLWTPEHLLLASVAGCFVATFRAIADMSKMEFRAIEVPVEGMVAKQEGGLRFTKIVVRPELSIFREEDRERASRLLEKAERSCLVTRSLSSEVVLQAKVLVEAPLPV
jgi:peroxiredoxin-like protein